jgi:branched-chain amino acid transport system ATP-binding protein
MRDAIRRTVRFARPWPARWPTTSSHLGKRQIGRPSQLLAAPPRSRYLLSPEGEAAGMAGEYLIETEDLSKEFKGFLAVSEVNLRVRRGSIHALIGPNGAGKTTVFNLLTKFLEPTRGRILYDGRDITRAKPADLAREGMVRSFQISATFPHLSVLENVRIALQRRLGTSFHFWRSEASLDLLNERAEELIEAVGLAGFEGSTAAELPYGRKRALEIATTLALEPKLMLLDEPTAGMGHEDVGRVAELIRKVAEDRTVLMVEHNLSVVADLSDVITVLQRGRVLAEGSYDEVSINPEVREAYMGTGHA